MALVKFYESVLRKQAGTNLIEIAPGTVISVHDISDRVAGEPGTGSVIPVRAVDDEQAPTVPSVTIDALGNYEFYIQPGKYDIKFVGATTTAVEDNVTIGGETGPQGLSAYQVWLAEGNTGTEQDYLDSLVGADGDSAYQVWLSQGNTGTESDYLASLQGDPGTSLTAVQNPDQSITVFQDGVPVGTLPPGEDGTNGTNVTAVDNLDGTITVFQDGVEVGVLRSVDQAGWELVSDSQYTDANPLAVNAITGPQQITINGLGDQNFSNYLPPGVDRLWNTTTNRIESHRIGAAYNVRLTMTGRALTNNSVVSIRMDIGGTVGAIWAQDIIFPKGLTQDTPFSFTIPTIALDTFAANGAQLIIESSDSAEFYDFAILIQMITAEQGAEGPSAYQAWLDAGNTGTEADFIEAIRGPAGLPAEAGPRDVLTTVAQSISPNTPTAIDLTAVSVGEAGVIDAGDSTRFILNRDIANACFPTVLKWASGALGSYRRCFVRVTRGGTTIWQSGNIDAEPNASEEITSMGTPVCDVDLLAGDVVQWFAEHDATFAILIIPVPVSEDVEGQSNFIVTSMQGPVGPPAALSPEQEASLDRVAAGALWWPPEIGTVDLPEPTVQDLTTGRRNINIGDGNGKYEQWVWHPGRTAQGTDIAAAGAVGGAWVKYVDEIGIVEFDGADNTGATVVSADLNDWLANTVALGGRHRLKPGTYQLLGDLTIYSTAALTNQTQISLDLTGCTFTGTGDIVVDSMKNIEIIGGIIPGGELVINGMWWSQVKNIKAQAIHFGKAAGTIFGATYWNNFLNCVFGSVKLGLNRQAVNINVFLGGAIRSKGGQGINNNSDYCIEDLSPDQLMQKMVFNGTDISYGNIGFININPLYNRQDAQIDLIGCYLDTLHPEYISGMFGYTVTQQECHYGTLNGARVSYLEATRQNVSGKDTLRASGWKALGGVNYYRDGNFKTAGLSPEINRAGATITQYLEGGVAGGYININQLNTASNAVIFPVDAVLVEGRYTGSVIIRNADPGPKDLKLDILGNFPSITVDDKWQLINSAPLAALSGTPNIKVFTDDGTPFNVDICSLSCVAGQFPLCIPPDDPVALADRNGPVVANVAPANTVAGALDILDIEMPNVNQTYAASIDLTVGFTDRSFPTGGGILRASVTIVLVNGGGAIANVTMLDDYNFFTSGGAGAGGFTLSVDPHPTTTDGFRVSVSAPNFATLGEPEVSFSAQVKHIGLSQNRPPEWSHRRYLTPLI